MSPIDVKVEIRFRKNEDGSVNAGAYEITGGKAAQISGDDFYVFEGTSEDIDSLKSKLEEIYGQVVTKVQQQT